ncbi:hypothetical protein GW915_09865 [bacterium]|nr:hypothetical protein [bacterium]
MNHQEQKTDRPEAELERWFSVSLLDLWSLFLKFSSNEQDFSELSSRVTRRLISKSLSSSAHAEREFFRLWSKKFHLTGREDLEQICVVLACELAWPIEKVSFFTGLTSSRVSFFITQTFKRYALMNNDLPEPLGADCARVDLYLTELLLERSLPGLKNKAILTKKHTQKCPRCSQLFDVGSTLLVEMVEKEKTPFPEKIAIWLRSFQEEKVAILSPVERHLFSSKLLLKLPVVVLIVLTVVGGVSSIPYIGKLNFTLPRFPIEFFQAQKPVVVDSIDEWIDIDLQSRTLYPPWIEHDEAYLAKNEVFAIHRYLLARGAELAEVEETATNSSVEDVVAEPKLQSSKKITSSRLAFYRWGAYSADLSADTQYLKTLLKDLQAIQAGELELGAEYKGGSYFHFEVPSEKFDSLNEKVSRISLENFTSNRARSTRASTKGYVRVVFLVLPKK